MSSGETDRIRDEAVADVGGRAGPGGSRRAPRRRSLDRLRRRALLHLPPEEGSPLHRQVGAFQPLDTLGRALKLQSRVSLITFPNRSDIWETVNA